MRRKRKKKGKGSLTIKDIQGNHTITNKENDISRIQIVQTEEILQGINIEGMITLTKEIEYILYDVASTNHQAIALN